MNYSLLTIHYSLASTHYQLLTVVAALLPSYLLRFSVFGIPTNALEVLIGLTFLTGLLSPTVRVGWHQSLRGALAPKQSQSHVRWVLIMVLAFVIASIISIFISPHLETSLGILKGWILIPLLYACMVVSSPNIGEARWGIINSLLFSGLITALYSFSQLGQLPRLQGWYDHPNSLALFLVPLTTLSFFLSLQKKGFPIYYSHITIILFLAIIGTQSLAATLAVAVGIIVGYLIIWKLGFDWTLDIGHWAFTAATAGVIVVLTVMLLTPKLEYLMQPSSSASVRLQLWSISWELIQENPILGIGLGTFEPAYQQKLHERFRLFENCNIENSMKIENCKLKIQTPPLAEFVYRDPHNWLFSFWLNTGLLGLLSFAALNTYTLVSSYQFLAPKNKQQNTGESYLKIGLIIALFTILLHGIVDTIYWKNDLAIFFWLLLILLLPTVKARALK